MRTSNDNILKKLYFQPKIELVKLDNEISLALESIPPGGPGEVNNNLAPVHFNNNPFNTNIG